MDQTTGQRFSRRAALKALAAGSIVSLVAACTGAAPQAAPTATLAAARPTSAPPPTAAVATTVAPAVPQPAAAPQPTTQLQPRAGGTLRLGILGDPISLDGHVAGPFDTVYHVFDTLIVQDEHLAPQPLLAESFTQSADKREVVFKIRQGATWHSGRAVTSDDVKWNLDRVRDPKVAGGILFSYARPLTSIELPDPQTIVLRSTDPWPGVFDFIQRMNVLDPVAMQGTDALTHPVGTGPFAFAEFRQGDALRLVKNKNYWLPGRPYVDELIFQVFRDPQSMAAQFEAGAIDGMIAPTLRDTVRYQKDGRYQVILNSLAGESNMLLANASKPPTDNKMLRQALNFAIDRQRVVDTVLLGLSRPLNLPYLPPSPAFSEQKNAVYTFDLDKARSLLAQAGVSNVEVPFNFASTSAEWQDFGQIYQADLAKIGITLTLKPTEGVSLNQMYVTQSYIGLATATHLYGNLHPSLMASSPYYAPLTNWEGFHDDAYTQLCRDLQVEIDPVKAPQVWDQWQDFVLDQSFAISVTRNLPRTVVSQRVQGLRYTIAEMLKATEAWLA